MHFLRFLLVYLILTSTCFAVSIPEHTKRFIYEITSPGIGRGTGFVLNDSLLKFVLVTCRHVVKDTAGNYVDSILLRRNRLLPTGELIADTSKFVLRLKVNGALCLAEHPNSSVDLVMIPLIPGFNTPEYPGEYFYGQPSSTILSKEDLENLNINEGTDVQLIGFSLSSSLSRDSTHYHFSRFGKVGLYTTNQFTLVIDGEPRTANFILLDMSTRPGDSGSPILTQIGDVIYLIGFIAATSEKAEFGIGYPVYYLHDLIEVIKNRLRSDKQTGEK